MLEKIISVIQAQIQQEEKEIKEKEENIRKAKLIIKDIERIIPT